MPILKFTSSLKRFYPNLGDLHLEGNSLNLILNELDQQFPGLKGYILDDQQNIRKHVNIFIDGVLHQSINLDIEIEEQSEIYIIQALSGG